MRLFLLVFLFVSAEALACSVIDEPTLPERYEEASNIFLARIVETHLVEEPTAKYEWDRENVEATFELIESFKGPELEPPTVREHVFGPGNCTLGLMAGVTYVFFLYDDSRYVGWPGGSFMTWNVDATDVKPILEELRSLRDQVHDPALEK